MVPRMFLLLQSQVVLLPQSQVVSASLYVFHNTRRPSAVRMVNYLLSPNIYY